MEFGIRFLLSSLVDADRLDAEAFEHLNLLTAVTGGLASVATLRQRLDHHIGEKTRLAKPTTVNRIRVDVLEYGRQAAELAPGFFSLTLNSCVSTHQPRRFATRVCEGPRWLGGNSWYRDLL